MLRTSPPETTLADPAKDLADGATDLVEAATAEDAIARVHAEMGPHARIVDARRERRGGIGGFFTTEVVQLHVAPAAPSPGSTATQPPPVDRLLDGADEVAETMDFATFLRQQMLEEAAPAPSPGLKSSGAVDGDGTGEIDPGPSWSTTALLHLGIPVELVRAVGSDAPPDDIAWTTALAKAVSPVCGPVPDGPALLVGPLADLLQSAVPIPTARSRMWFDALSEGRWVHLVVGGAGWREHLASGPRVVSWARPDDLPDALRCAFELDLTLGYGPSDGVLRRMRPLDVALAIRARLDAG